MNFIYLKYFVSVSALIVAFQARALKPSPPNPTKLLEKSDRARGGLSKGLAWNVRIETVQDGNSSGNEYEVRVKDVDVLAKCTAPPRQKDEVFLFNDRNLWVYRPGLRKPISVSPRQRLSGQAANGDIATTNYARDYEGKVVGEETVNGQSTYKLELKAKSKDVTYDGITYWISKDKNLGVQAEFLTLEGKPFKRALFEYKNTISAAGTKTPFVSQMKIIDVTFPKNVTTLTYSKPSATKLEASDFNVNNLAR
jgi:hypothetical protein